MLLKWLAAAAAVATAVPAAAVVLVSNPASTGELASPGSTSVTFFGPAAAGAADFVIQGFRSLDGVNPYQDTFTLSLNGTDVYSASFDLGGGGADAVFLAPAGATDSIVSFGFFVGGEASIHTPLTLVAGTNTLTFRYDGDAQGVGDEAWGIRALTVTSATIPEPASWALLLGGFVIVGAAARRRPVVLAA